ncbi:Gti1/Pac2 family-domain-containing protein [Xylaria longipes]|nr:Gti1/Pac2 family-domain-containing protein [Xylaria longipes]RYC60025.1 hypothetical protein CHU98_g6185 [Xylaria longipes]
MHTHSVTMETYIGCVRTPADAIKLFEACRLGLLPRVQRRLSEKERQSIRPGSVFVWDEREAGMRRWTDGKSWSASRVSGSFLTYREMEGKRGSGFGTSRRTTTGRSPDSGRLSDDDQDGEPEGYRYKTDGLMKQSFSITTSQGQHLHLISYYARLLPGAPELLQPTTDPSLRHITPPKGMYPESSLHDANPPALTRTPMPSYNSPGSQDQGTYGTQWASPAWMGVSAWPHSPSQMSPYPYGKPEPEMAHQAHPPPQSRRAPQLPPSVPANHSPFYERLPPPTYQMDDRHSSRSPRSQQLQVQAAQAVMINPRMTISARNSQGPLPAMGIAPSPPRTKSISPPHTSSSVSPSDVSARKASLSSILLHPAPSSSEPNSANSASKSASSSPRALAAVPHDLLIDRQALRSLDRKFCP